MKRMKCRLSMMVMVTCLGLGCASSRFVLCVSPQGCFKPESESEFRAELDAQLPFTTSSKNFISQEKASGLVGWVVVRNHEQKDAVKESLTTSATLKVLQVEAMTPEFKALMKQQRTQNL